MSLLFNEPITLNQKQKMIVKILMNADDFVTAREIQRMTGLSPRNIRLEVSDLRWKGVPIESGNYGYKIAKTRKEAERCIRRLRATARSIKEVADAMAVSKFSLPAE